MSSPSPVPATPVNPFITGSIPRVFVRTALPIILVTSVNGLLTVVDAILLGGFVGPEALTAVTLMFPISMLLVACSTMVAIGMASVLSRMLGAGRIDEARKVFAGAHGLSLALCAVCMALFAAFGWPAVMLATGGSATLGEMGHTFLSISIFTSPVAFLLSVHGDALRTEGRMAFMAIVGVLLSLANIGFNLALIVGLQMGVAGSAWGTFMAQVLGLAAILVFRSAGKGRLGIGWRDARDWRFGWRDLLALGAPRSLTFIGISLGAGAIIFSLSALQLADGEATIAAYGVVTRIMTFAFFPLLGMSLALQAMIGNNYGARLWARSDASLRVALGLSFCYSVLLEALLMLFRDSIGGVFVDDPATIAAVARIIPLFMPVYFAFGPMMMISSYFQAIGDVGRAALLALSRTYLFAIPLTLILPMFFGETGIWIAAPIADLLLIVVTGLVLMTASRSRGTGWGLFEAGRRQVAA